MSWNTLPSELISEILYFVEDERADLVAASRTCQRWRGAALRLLYREVSPKLDDINRPCPLTHLLITLSNAPYIADCVETIKLPSRCERYEWQEPFLDFKEFPPHVMLLRHLDVLATRIFPSDENGSQDRQEQLRFKMGVRNRNSIALLTALFASCPNLKHLETPFVLHPLSWPFLTTDNSRRVVFPRLQSLYYHYYDACWEDVAVISLLPTIVAFKTNSAVHQPDIGVWDMLRNPRSHFEKFNWSHSAREIPITPLSLRSLSMKIGPVFPVRSFQGPAFGNFLRQRCPQLESLSIEIKEGLFQGACNWDLGSLVTLQKLRNLDIPLDCFVSRLPALGLVRELPSSLENLNISAGLTSLSLPVCRAILAAKVNEGMLQSLRWMTMTHLPPDTFESTMRDPHLTPKDMTAIMKRFAKSGIQLSFNFMIKEE